MEDVTVSMQKIADETKQEAINMRIITLVTLVFLPGTFVSVSLFGRSQTIYVLIRNRV